METILRVEGGRALHGTVRVPGAKNSVLPLLAASLLCEGPVVLENAPRLSDVDTGAAILRSLGCTVRAGVCGAGAELFPCPDAGAPDCAPGSATSGVPGSVPGGAASGSAPSAFAEDRLRRASAAGEGECFCRPDTGAPDRVPGGSAPSAFAEDRLRRASAAGEGECFCRPDTAVPDHAPDHVPGDPVPSAFAEDRLRRAFAAGEGECFCRPDAAGASVESTPALFLDGAGLCGSTVPPPLMAAMRSSLFFLAPLLVRTGSAHIGQPGGCTLGARPIDLHLAGLAAMGAQVEQRGGEICVRAPQGLHGTDFTLRFPSVGATETLLMAAARARGRTVLRGAACEPEVQDLARFLRRAGARVEGIGTPVLTVEGAPELRSVRWRICPDRIVAATVLCAAAACGGDVLLTDCRPAHLLALYGPLGALGCTFALRGSRVRVHSDGPGRGFGHLATGGYPALATDAAPLLLAASLRAAGESAVLDTVFEDRFSCARGFAALGAEAAVHGAQCTVRGVPRLHGAPLRAADLRGGAALLLAALQADGPSTLGGLACIDRGYEDIARLFAGLGAAVERVPAP